MYAALKLVSALALRWFYRDVRIDGAERVPRTGPVLFAVNHPNALLDVLVPGCLLPRRLTLTGKATLFDNPIIAPILRSVGVVPLRRVSDEAQAGKPVVDRTRNAQAFEAILGVLERGGAVLIFPEGKVQNEPYLAPLKTGLARIALQARDERHIRGLSIVPLGLNFEDKGVPRSRVCLEVGEPIRMDEWHPNASNIAPAQQLTAEVDERLRAVTLNFPSAEEADRVRTAAELLAGLHDDLRPMRDPDPSLAQVLEMTRRVDATRRMIDRVSTFDSGRVALFVRRLDAFRIALDERQIPVTDIAMSTDKRPALGFLVREGAIVAAAGPLAWWGRINHWIPFRLARLIAHRTSVAPDQPAQHTIVSGIVLVLLFYGLQTGLVAWLAGWPWWLLYLISLPISATWDLRYQDRMDRAKQRMRAYLLLRREPGLQERLLDEVAWLREESAALERLAIERASVGAHAS
jgi:glycerol-3-phosphate O-acyltransferase / dihydroxyacetone phosphate acyltransferase